MNETKSYKISCDSPVQAATLQTWFAAAGATHKAGTSELIANLEDQQVAGLRRDYALTATPLENNGPV